MAPPLDPLNLLVEYLRHRLLHNIGDGKVVRLERIVVDDNVMRLAHFITVSWVIYEREIAYQTLEVPHKWLQSGSPSRVQEQAIQSMAEHLLDVLSNSIMDSVRKVKNSKAPDPEVLMRNDLEMGFSGRVRYTAALDLPAYTPPKVSLPPSFPKGTRVVRFRKKEA
jgi:hypothetical protein